MIDLLDRRRILRRQWRHLSLAQQFAVAGGLFTIMAMLLGGILTTTIMTSSLLHRHGHVVALLMQHIIAPSESMFDANAILSREEVDRLDGLMQRSVIAQQFPYLDIWREDGLILFSNMPGIGLTALPEPDPVSRAFAGEVFADFSDIDSVDHLQHGFSGDFIEIYFPLRDPTTDSIVAVAQVREVTAYLEETLQGLTFATWLSVGATSAVVIAGLYGIVQGGSLTIERQRKRLILRLQQTQRQVARNRQLKDDAQRVSRSVTKFADEHLRTIGTDLHDGPAQAIGLAMLKVELARRSRAEGAREIILYETETVLSDALKEMRDISSGLVLPDIDQLGLAQIIEHAAALHVRKTGVEVHLDIRVGAVRQPRLVAVCAFRFVQEGLNNAFHHGVAERPMVTAIFEAGVLKLSVVNNYSSDRCNPHIQGDHGLGLHGMRARVESIGGNFIFVQDAGQARVEMWVEVQDLQQDFEV